MSKKLKSPVKPIGTKVSGIGVYRPEKIVTNDEIAPLINS